MNSFNKIVLPLILFHFLTQSFMLSGQEEPKREFRATWIATVSNLDWPKYEHRNQPELQKAELIRMLDIYESLNLNAVLLQVRPECDAFYNSAYEPWSRYLTWTQGDDPGYDPLQFAIDEAHKRGIELHVWLNPYRINASTSDGGSYYASNHVYVEHPEWAIEYDSGKKILNPGLPEVMSYIGSVVRDIVSNYDVDGVHFDDYFYSYDGTPNSLDQTAYDLYGNGMSRADWRRSNVNRMIDTVYSVIQEVNSNVRFGVSPFGIYQNGVPDGIYGLDAYSTIYCDPLTWLQDSTVDYVNPQLYWPTGGHQDFETLADWWSDQVFANNRHFYAGHAIYRLDNNPPKQTSTKLHELKSYFDIKTTPVHEEKLYFNIQNNNYSNLEKNLKGTGDPVAEWTLSQVGLQIDLVRNNQAKNGLGSVYFRADDFERVNGLTDYLTDNKYTHKALVPEMTWKTAQTPVAPVNITDDGTTLSWDYTGSDNDRFAVYIAFDSINTDSIISNANNLSKVTFSKNVLLSDLNFSTGSYVVITAVSPIGTESEPGEIYKINNDWPIVELLSPENNQTVGFNDSLSWHSTNQNAEYYLETSTGSGFNNIVYSSNWSSSTSLNIELMELNGEETYYWHVKAKTDIEGPYSSYRLFTTGFPTVPAITYPGQLETNVSTNPIIKWDASGAAAQIRVVISEDLNFATTAADETFDAAAGQGQIVQQLNKGTWYYVKIMAINEYGKSDYSSSKTFETTSGEIPDAVLLTPDNNSTVASFDKLKWSTTTTTGTISFLLEVSLEENFTNLIYSSNWTEDTEILISYLQIQGGVTYYWHVKAKSEFGEGMFSETRSFIPGYPARPSIIAPSNLSTGVSVRPTVEWSVDSNTDSVLVEFSEEYNFNHIYTGELFDATISEGTLTSSSLRGYTWYYLRISAKNNYGYSVYSSIRSLKTGEGNAITELVNGNLLNIFQDEALNIYLQFVTIPNEKVNINIYDMLGKLVYSANINQSVTKTCKINKPEIINEGLYFVSIKEKNKIITKKVFIK